MYYVLWFRAHSLTTAQLSVTNLSSPQYVKNRGSLQIGNDHEFWDDNFLTLKCYSFYDLMAFFFLSVNYIICVIAPRPKFWFLQRVIGKPTSRLCSSSYKCAVFVNHSLRDKCGDRFRGFAKCIQPADTMPACYFLAGSAPRT